MQKEKRCLHILAHKVDYKNGEALTCSSCKTVMRFTTLEDEVFMFPNGGSMTTASNSI